MAERILITPQELRDAADFLAKAKEEIVEKVGQVSSKIDEISGNWEGAAQSTFVDNYAEIKPTLDTDFPEIIFGLSEQLKAAADAIESADQEVANSMSM